MTALAPAVTPIQKVLNALTQHGSKVRSAGPGQYLAQCPAHDDRTPSLSIREAGDGKVLAKCFAGCITEAILAAIGLQFADLSPAQKRERADDEIVATYDYRTSRGDLVFQVVRKVGKRFTQRRPDSNGGWVPSVKDLPPEKRIIPYRLPDLDNAVVKAEEKDERAGVVIVEGEKDADRLWALGIPATCNAGGAGKWTLQHAQHLAGLGFVHVMVLADRDEPGKAHAEAVVRSCRAAGLTVVEGGFMIATCPCQCKDASDLALRHGDNVDEWPLVTIPVPEGGAQDAAIETTIDCAKAEEPVATEWQLDATVGTDMRRAATEWIWKDWLARGSLHLLAGSPGKGKSTWAAWLAAKLTTGDPWPGETTERPPCRVGYLSVGEGSEVQIGARLEDNGVAMERLVFLNGRVRRKVQDRSGSLREELSTWSFPRHLDALERTIRVQQLDAVIIDGFGHLIDGDGNAYSDVASRVGAVRELAERTGCAIVGITHMAKRGAADPATAAIGSVGWAGAVDLLWLLGVDRNDETRRVVVVAKRNIGSEGSGWSFAVKPGERYGAGAVVDVVQSDVQPHQIAAPAAPAEQDQDLDQAVLDILDAHGGTIPRKMLAEELAEAGFDVDRKAVGRALDRLGYKSQRDEGDRFGWIVVPKSSGQSTGSRVDGSDQTTRRPDDQTTAPPAVPPEPPCGWGKDLFATEADVLPEELPDHLRDAPAVRCVDPSVKLDMDEVWATFRTAYAQAPWGKDILGAWADHVIKAAAAARHATNTAPGDDDGPEDPFADDLDQTTVEQEDGAPW